MTNAELIAKLQTFPPDALVLMQTSDDVDDLTYEPLVVDLAHVTQWRDHRQSPIIPGVYALNKEIPPGSNEWGDWVAILFRPS